MISLRSVSIAVGDQQIISWLDYDFILGKQYCLLGKNGSGKSSLAYGLMGHPSYTVTWDVTLDGEDLLAMDVDERAKAGIFLAFQAIPEIPGIKVFEFLRSIYHAKTDDNIGLIPFKKKILPLCDQIGLDHDLLWRDLNVWFSGGERRKLEVLQIKLLEPRYIVLDEVDSGLDVDAFHAIAWLLASCVNDQTTLIIITHLFTILDYVKPDHVIVMDKGKIIKEWGPDLALRVKEWGFRDLIE